MTKGKKITINVVPAHGDPVEIQVEPTHTTVKAALKAAKIATSASMQYAVNGKPATLDDAVRDGDNVTATEKVRGS